MYLSESILTITIYSITIHIVFIFKNLLLKGDENTDNRFYTKYTGDYIYKCIIDDAKERCFKEHGKPFSYICPISFPFYEKYNLRKRFPQKEWDIEGEPIAVQSAFLLTNLKAAIDRLPPDLHGEIIMTKSGDQRHNPEFSGTCFTVCITYSININVSLVGSMMLYREQFSVLASKSAIYHADILDKTFEYQAYSFYNKIKKQHIETMKHIAEELRSLCSIQPRPTLHIRTSRSGAFYIMELCSGREFEDFGMAPLPDAESVYGFTMLLIELFAKPGELYEVRKVYDVGTNRKHILYVDTIKLELPIAIKNW